LLRRARGIAKNRRRLRADRRFDFPGFEATQSSVGLAPATAIARS
jgi:hypothetical protein